MAVKRQLRMLHSNGWHYQPFAAASTLSAARAIAKLQVAREADAHLPQSSTIAVDGDAFGRPSIIRADKRIDDSTAKMLAVTAVRSVLLQQRAARDRKFTVLTWHHRTP
jgi:hypothetical protein